MDVIIIGAGAAGLMAANILEESRIPYKVLERNPKPGKKLYITGKGRCNFTNDCDERTFLMNVVTNSKFLTSSIYGFNATNCIDFFESKGLRHKVERGGRVFPLSDKSSDVIKALSRDVNANIKYGVMVKSIDKTDIGFVIHTDCGTYESDKVIVATGGCSYPMTGSDGFGYTIAKKFGHTVISPKSALCPILTDSIASKMQGVSLKNVTLSYIKDAKVYRREFGEMLFTDRGASGPIALTLSSFMTKDDLTDSELSIDFKPALDRAKLDERILRDFDSSKNKDFVNILGEFLPRGCIVPFASKLSFSPNKKINNITKDERLEFLELLKDFRLKVRGLAPVEEGIITSGGIKVGEINPATMQSKIVDGLYFAGEILDVDALTGGFNLQIAFCTAVNAAESIKEELL